MEVIEQIKRTASIRDIAAQYTSLRRSGKRLVGLCPFHSEKTPSFTIDEEKQLFHCFGCGAGGDLFTLVMEKENLSFPETLRYLARKYGIPLPERRNLSPQVKKLEEKTAVITEKAQAFFRKNLHNTEEGRKALAYLRKRGISEETVQTLKLGYALNTWDALISALKRQGFAPKDLERAGLAVYHQERNSYYDRFRGRVIFPIFDETGKAVGFGGRSTIGAEPKYLNSPDTPIYTKGKLLYGLNFTKEYIREKETVILVEGYTDFITLFQAGIKNVAAALGTSLTPTQVDQAKRFAREKMVVCFDGDTAGIKASSRAVSLGFEKGIKTRVVPLPGEADPDSFLKEHGPEAFKQLVETAVPGLRFLIRTMSGGKSIDSPEDKSKAVRHVLEEVEKIPDPVVRSESIKQVAEHFAVEETVLRAMARGKTGGKDIPVRDFFLPAEKRLLRWVFAGGVRAGTLMPLFREEAFQGLRSEPIFDLVIAGYRKRKKIPGFHELREKIDRALFGSLSEALMENGSLPTEEEVRDCIDALKIFTLEKRGKEIDARIAVLQRKKDEEKIAPLLNQRLEITRQLSLLAQKNS